MNEEHLLGTGPKLKALADYLATCPQVTRYDTGDEREAWTLTHTFADLEASFRKFLEEQLPKLTEGELPPDDIYSLLLEIGEELRHILYHARDARFYRYLLDEPEVRKAHG